jgi:hypothetical protein
MSVNTWQYKLLVEAAGVELSSVLTARKLLISGTATTAKKAPLPDPLYVYCTKMLFAPESDTQHMRPQYRIDSQKWIEKAPSFVRYRKSLPFHFFDTPSGLLPGCPLPTPIVARHQFPTSNGLSFAQIGTEGSTSSRPKMFSLPPPTILSPSSHNSTRPFFATL